jgi:hypothetical protein
MVMKRYKTLFVMGMFVFFGPSISAQEPESASNARQADTPSRPQILLVEQSRLPTVEVTWIVDGQERRFEKPLPYTAPVGGEPVGENIMCYVTLGGTRVDTGAGHPKGAVIRLGITKVENARAFFKGIDPGTDIVFAISGVEFNQPVKYHDGTGMMHLKYALGDLKACALPGSARNQYLLSDPQDTLGGRVVAGENATPGALSGINNIDMNEDKKSAVRNGDLIVEVDDQDPTLVNMRIRVPYGLLRHLQDPWKSTLPGTFFEPVHMHGEAELIPIDAEQLERDPFYPELNPTSNAIEEAAQEETNED